MEKLRTKSKLLTQYMQYLVESEINSLETASHFKIQILTPTDPEQRGAQLSLRVIGVDARQLFDELERLGVCVSFIFIFRIINYFISSVLLVRYS